MQGSSLAMLHACIVVPSHPPPPPPPPTHPLYSCPMPPPLPALRCGRDVQYERLHKSYEKSDKKLEELQASATKGWFVPQTCE